MARARLGTLLLALLLSACNTLQSLLPQPKPFEAHVVGEGYQTVAPGETATYTLRLSFQEGAGPVTLRVALADPCAKGTSSCPGWDSTRYPGVEHPRETFTLTPGAPEVSLVFQVATSASPQGPFKYEVVLTGQDASGKTVEEIVPLYLKILHRGETSAMEYWNFWRDYMGHAPVREDPEWGFRAWLHGRYLMMNVGREVFAHDEDLSYPFSSPEGREAGQKGLVNSTATITPTSTPDDQAPWPLEGYHLNAWVAAPFHRLSVIWPSTSAGGFGAFLYREPVTSHTDILWSVATLPITEASWPNPTSGSLLFPVPDKVVPLNHYRGEWPSPDEACENPDRSEIPPYMSHTGLDWSQPPYGLPLSVSVFPTGSGDTKVVEARLVRLSDGQELPVCGLGSLQFWNQDTNANDVGKLLLKGNSTVFVVPRYPLDPGEAYRAEVRAVFGSTEKTFTWSFQVAPQDEIFPIQAP